jgi:hypothetical protein
MPTERGDKSTPAASQVEIRFQFRAGIRRVEKGYKTNGNARSSELQRHLKGDGSTGTQAAEEIRPAGLDRTDTVQVIRRHFRNRGMENRVLVVAIRLDSVNSNVF